MQTSAAFSLGFCIVFFLLPNEPPFLPHPLASTTQVASLYPGSARTAPSAERSPGGKQRSALSDHQDFQLLVDFIPQQRWPSGSQTTACLCSCVCVLFPICKIHCTTDWSYGRKYQGTSNNSLGNPRAAERFQRRCPHGASAVLVWTKVWTGCGEAAGRVPSTLLHG